jgi:hypothetical protein
VRHKAVDEVHVAAQAVELGDDDRGFRLAGRGRCLSQHRSAIECVGALAGLDLDVLGQDSQPFGLDKLGNCFALCLEAQTAFALTTGAYPEIRDNRTHRNEPFAL